MGSKGRARNPHIADLRPLWTPGLSPYDLEPLCLGPGGKPRMPSPPLSSSGNCILRHIWLFLSWINFKMQQFLLEEEMETERESKLEVI